MLKKPSALSEDARFKAGEDPFVVQVSHRDTNPYPYKVATAHIAVRQSGVVLEGATSVVDPYTGIASFDKFKLASSNNLEYINYDIISSGVVCRDGSSTFDIASSLLFGTLVKIATVPSVIELFGAGAAEPRVFVGVESALVMFHVYDRNFANLDGVVVSIKV